MPLGPPLVSRECGPVPVGAAPSRAPSTRSALRAASGVLRAGLPADRAPQAVASFRQLDPSQATVLAAVRSRRSLAHQDYDQASGEVDAPLFSRPDGLRWAPGNNPWEP